MNLTVELVQEWGRFEENYPNANLNDFCRYYLVHHREKQDSDKFLGGIVPPKADQTLAKLMDRTMKLYFIYAAPALKVVGIKSFDEFLYINSIGNLEKPRKTDVITANFNELSSGLLIIERLAKKGYVEEVGDDIDKRSKRLSLTYKGKSVLKACYEQLRLLNDLFFGHMPNEDIELCIQLLTPLEIKFSKNWQKDKNRSFEEIKENHLNE
jgi:predicted transcriptional regulator